MAPEMMSYIVAPSTTTSVGNPPDDVTVQECVSRIDSIYEETVLSEDDLEAFEFAKSLPPITQNIAFIRATSSIE